jgi:hypothetical protein
MKDRIIIWRGERNRRLDVYRPCSCGTCSAVRGGPGYLSGSDPEGLGFTLWIQDENVLREMKEAIRHLRKWPPEGGEIKKYS